MFTIRKTFHLSYGHRLHPYAGKCANLHGHNAVIAVTLQTGKLNAQGMVMAYLPQDKIIIQADLFTPPAPPFGLALDTWLFLLATVAVTFSNGSADGGLDIAMPGW